MKPRRGLDAFSAGVWKSDRKLSASLASLPATDFTVDGARPAENLAQVKDACLKTAYWAQSRLTEAHGFSPVSLGIRPPP